MKLSEKSYPAIMCIYKILNTQNNKVYIGSTNLFNRRMQKHRYELKHGKHSNLYLQNSYNLYGIDSFEVYIEQQFDVPIPMTELHKIEQTYIDKYNSRDENFGYNLMDVDIPRSFNEWSEESRNKLLAYIDTRKIPVLAFSKDTGDFIGEYKSVTEAAESIHTSSTNVSAVCKHRLNYFKGAVFIYKNEYDPNKSYKYIRPKREFTEEHIRRLRLGCRKSIAVDKFDANGNIVQHFISISDAIRTDKLKTHFLKFCDEEMVNGYVYRKITDQRYSQPVTEK